MIILRTFAEVRALTGGPVSLVPTMGYLHEGHLSLIEVASKDEGPTVVSLFVNPTQFGDAADLDAYPQDERRDAALAAAAGADVLFAPDAAEMYPENNKVTVAVGGVGDAMEGRFRHGHFEGVATVVAKLFAGIAPARAYFGRKDAQQLAVVVTMRNGLRFAVDIVGLPTVRERDGLALSSRNARIDPLDRKAAAAVSTSLFAGADVIEAGEVESATITRAIASVLSETPEVDVEYIEVADSATAALVERIEHDSFVAVAARVGGVRLIDNVAVDGASLRVDRGTTLQGTSILYEED